MPQLHSENDEHSCRVPSVDDPGYVRNLIMIGDGNDRQAFALGRVHHRSGCCRSILDVMWRAEAVDVEIAAEEFGATAQ